MGLSVHSSGGCPDGGRQPMRWWDSAACWLENPRDMVAGANSLWLDRIKWNNGMYPCGIGACPTDWSIPLPDDKVGGVPIYYWGWNEAPCTSSILQPENWDAIVIKMSPSQRSMCDLL